MPTLFSGYAKEELEHAHSKETHWPLKRYKQCNHICLVYVLTHQMECQLFRGVAMVFLYLCMFKKRLGANIKLGVSYKSVANISSLLTGVDSLLVFVNTSVHWTIVLSQCLKSSWILVFLMKWLSLNFLEKAVCLKRQKIAQTAHVPFSVLVTLGDSQKQITLSVHEPIIHHFSRLGRVMVTYNSTARTWHCPCAKP